MSPARARQKGAPRPVATAMLLAAGLGTRLRPLTENLPKPLVRVAGQTLLTRGLDILAAAGVARAVINTHYLAHILTAYIEQIRPHYAMELLISDESDALLDSAGGIIKALPLLGGNPFFVLNADSFWREGAHQGNNLLRLSRSFNPAAQDMLLLTVPPEQSLVPRKGDFLADKTGCLSRADKAGAAGRAVVYAGGMIVSPAVFAGAPKHKAQSLKDYFDKSLAQRRLYGLDLQGEWFSVGSPAESQAAEARLAQSGGAVS